MFSYRSIKDNDYDTFCEWGKWFRFQMPPKEFLPDNGNLGVVITKEDIDICVGFLYLTNSKIAWIEFIFSNPGYKNKDRKEAIVLLINILSKIAKDNGYKAVFTSIKKENLIQYFLKCDFKKGSENTIEMIKFL